MKSFSFANRGKLFSLPNMAYLIWRSPSVQKLMMSIYSIWL